MRHGRRFWERVDSIVLRRRGALLVIDVDGDRSHEDVKENMVRLIGRVRKKLPIFVFEMHKGSFGAATDRRISAAIGKMKTIKKARESTFEGTDLGSTLGRRHIRELIAAGFFYDSSIRTTMQAR